VDRSSSVRSVALSGELVAVGFDDGRIEVSSLERGERIVQLEAPDAVTALAFSPDGRMLAAASYPSFGLYDLGARSSPGGPPFRDLPSFGLIRSIAFSPDGKWIANARDNAGVDLRDASTGEHIDWFGRYSLTYGEVWEQQSDFEYRSADVLSVAFDPSGRRFAVGSEDGLYFVDLDAHSHTRRADGRFAWVAFAGDRLLWSAPGGFPNTLGVELPAGCTALALAPDGCSLAMGCSQGIIDFVRLPR
jgi:WD40 repeat protein